MHFFDQPIVVGKWLFKIESGVLKVAYPDPRGLFCSGEHVVVSCKVERVDLVQNGMDNTFADLAGRRLLENLRSVSGRCNKEEEMVTVCLQTRRIFTLISSPQLEEEEMRSAMLEMSWTRRCLKADS